MQRGGSGRLPIPLYSDYATFTCVHDISVGPAHMMPTASHLIFMKAVVYDRVSLYKVPRVAKLVNQSRSGHSKTLAHRSKMV